MRPLPPGLALVMLLTTEAALAQEYTVTGMVLTVDRDRKTVTVSHQAIPGLMPAMAMPFAVRRTQELDDLVAGAMVEFTLVVDRRTSYAERIRVVRYESVEPDPLAARRLKRLNEVVRGPAAVTAVAVGEAVPDFTLTDQKGRQVTREGLRGKVVALNFVYTRCVLPDFCLRVANNFAVLQKRFTSRLGRDLVLLTVTFDPVHDTPAVLAQYAGQFNADSEHWRFLTGPVADVKRVCHLFGVNAFPDEGLMNHSLHTALIDRQGKLVANIEGNQFTATQLGDLTEAALR
jgi:protein SCO1/2